MNFELIDNALQVTLLGLGALFSFIFALRRTSRRLLVLALAYSSFAMGTLFFVLYLAIIGTVPQIFYVSEISWLSSYLFLLSLQLFRSKDLRVRFSWIAVAGTAVVTVTALVIRIFGPSYIVSASFALIADALIYISIYRLQQPLPHHATDAVLLLLCVLQVLLYLVSCFLNDYTRFNLYFAIDFVLTGTFTALLPVTLREVNQP